MTRKMKATEPQPHVPSFQVFKCKNMKTASLFILFYVFCYSMYLLWMLRTWCLSGCLLLRPFYLFISVSFIRCVPLFPVFSLCLLLRVGFVPTQRVAPIPIVPYDS